MDVSMQQLASGLRRFVRFRYLTVDRLSVKLWNEMPRFDFSTKVWVGSPSAWCGAVDAKAVMMPVPDDFSAAIQEVLDD